MNGRVIRNRSIRDRVSPAESTLYMYENEVHPGADQMKRIVVWYGSYRYERREESQQYCGLIRVEPRNFASM